MIPKRWFEFLVGATCLAAILSAMVLFVGMWLAFPLLVPQAQDDMLVVTGIAIMLLGMGVGALMAAVGFIREAY